jgi:transposase-like protein
MGIYVKKRQKRRRFTPEFKADTVRLVTQGGRSISAVARDLGVPISALARWVKQAEIDAGKGPPGSVTSSERAELEQLRRENQQLRMEREILKKAAAFFAKENQ